MLLRRLQGPIQPDYCAGRAYEIGDEEVDIACPTAHVENTHPWADAGLFEKAARDRLNQTGLNSESVQLLI